MFSNLKAKISGYKTYIVAIIAILSAITAWTGNQISLWNALQTILAAIATCTMRAAVQKSQDAAANNVAPTATPLAPPATIGNIPIPPTVNVTNNPHNIGDDLTRTGN